MTKQQDELDGFPKIVQAAPRRQWVPGCGYCADYKPTDMFPPHDQSRFCEGPSDRIHCACDWCF